MKNKQLAVLSLFGALVLSACGPTTSDTTSGPGSSLPPTSASDPSVEATFANGLKKLLSGLLCRKRKKS